MKNILLKILLVTIIFTAASCSVHSHTYANPNSSSKAKKVPPGQAKKANGDKSARNYAPGHNK